LFVEPSYSLPLKRLFDVSIEGELLVDNLDLASEVGQCNAYSLSFDVMVTDGQLNIDLAPQLGDAIISGIGVSFTAYLPTPTPTPTATHTPGPTVTPTFTPAVPPDLTIWGAPGMDPVYQTVPPPDGQTVPQPEWAFPAWTPVAITTDVYNDSTGPCNEFFWTDLYQAGAMTVPPPSKGGIAWQGLSGLGPYSGTTITFTHTFTSSGVYYLYTQVDSFEFVDELDENNNVSQPLSVSVYYDGPTPTATFTATPDPFCGSISGTVWAFIEGQLVTRQERAHVSLIQDGSIIATTTTPENPPDPADEGIYSFDCIPPGSGYTLRGTLEIGETLYVGTLADVSLAPNEVKTNQDIYLFPLF
nr:hypothetical protein [Anaerolineae bacterium]NIN98672.1 hypothetical protein [Anaerolineae bacterium]NIQ81557.1 hypothetical protein [Anaerolineae bacterium]